MIKSKSEYREFYKEDLKMTHILNGSIFRRITDRRYKFYRSLRLTEYYTNCRHDSFGLFLGKILRMRHKLLCNKFGWTIPLNVFNKGLCIVHVGTIVVSDKARVGINCRIHVDVNIGNAISHGISGTPCIGDNVYIAPGVKIFGAITIGDNIAIGANAVVNKSFENGNCTIAGIPARIISTNNSDNYIVDYE